jgi:hypothetical protein
VSREKVTTHKEREREHGKTPEHEMRFSLFGYDEAIQLKHGRIFGLNPLWHVMAMFCELTLMFSVMLEIGC